MESRTSQQLSKKKLDRNEFILKLCDHLLQISVYSVEDLSTRSNAGAAMA